MGGDLPVSPQLGQNPLRKRVTLSKTSPFTPPALLCSWIEPGLMKTGMCGAPVELVPLWFVSLHQQKIK